MSDASPRSVRIDKSEPRTCGGFVNPTRAWEIKMSDASPRSVRIDKSEPRTCGGFVNPPRA
ncbi:hypothetical protein QUF80_20035 [Desulfococcaceae bacterium HSG8]|nr:hypothetical protein [Desulfococcaceae bacterium HSG8]